MKRDLKITIPPHAGHFSTLKPPRFAAGQGAPKNLQCALPGSDFQVAQILKHLQKRDLSGALKGNSITG